MTDVPDVEFAVAGAPVGQGSMEALPLKGKRGGRPVMVYPPHVLEWRKMVRRMATVAMRDKKPLQGAVAMSLQFVLKRPQKIPTGRTAPAVQPDLDKLVRAIGDAIGLTSEKGGPGICMKDDAQIVEFREPFRKRYTEPGEVPGVIVRLWALDPQPMRLGLDRAEEAGNT